MSEAARQMLMNLVERQASAEDFTYETLAFEPPVHVFKVCSPDTHPCYEKTFRITLEEV